GWSGLRVLAYWSAPSPAAAGSCIRLAVLACLQAADGCQPAEPVIGDFVAFAAQLLGKRDLAQARAGVPGAGDDAPGGCDELRVTVAGVRIVLLLARVGFCPSSRDGTGWRASARPVAVEAGCMRTVLHGDLGGGRGPGGRGRGIGYRCRGGRGGDELVDGCVGSVGGAVVQPG